MTCDSCGQGLPSDARFCPACGTAVAERADGNGQIDANHPADSDKRAHSEQADDEQADGDGQTEGAGEQDTAAAERPSPEPTPTSRRVLTVVGNVLAVLAGGTVGVIAGLLIVRGW